MLEVIDNRVVEINQEHELFQRSMQTGLEHAIRCGELLVEAKGWTDWGDWYKWIEDNCSFSRRHADNYMKLATNRKRVSDLQPDTSLREALKLLSTPKEKRIQVQPEPTETSFSWIRDDDIVAMDAAFEIIDNGITKLLGATVEKTVANYLLDNIYAKLIQRAKRTGRR